MPTLTLGDWTLHTLESGALWLRYKLSSKTG